MNAKHIAMQVAISVVALVVYDKFVRGKI